MNAIREVIARILRGPGVSRFLERLGIDPRRYWLLVDLFDQLSDRGEALDELGRSGVTLRYLAMVYFVLFGLMSLAFAAMRTSLPAYSARLLGSTAFLMLNVLLMETGNSLVNPVEGLILAHQPINGATYTAAKLTQLARIVLYLAPGLNGVAAFAGLMLAGARWWYPIFHLAVALAVGFILALLCCALYGWLMRLLPPKRLRAAGQLAGTLPLVGFMFWIPLSARLARSGILNHLPEQAAVRWALGLACGAAAAIIVALGLRSLSADFLIRVSVMVRGGPAAGAKARKSRIGAVVARTFGGQAARAGFAFVSRMMLRDWHFRKQVAPMAVISLIWVVQLAAKGWRVDPFSGRFSTFHLLPHLFGLILFHTCMLLPYGDDFKGVWVFLLAPSRAFGPFVRGVYALLWIYAVVIPHAIVLPVVVWSWGAWHGALASLYSAAVVSLYLALELRLVDGAPFSRQPEASRDSTLLPVMIVAGIVVAVVVGLQYVLLFRSPVNVLVATVVAGAAAWFLTKHSLVAFERSIRYNLGLLSVEWGNLYKEVDA